MSKILHLHINRNAQNMTLCLPRTFPYSNIAVLSLDTLIVSFGKDKFSKLTLLTLAPSTSFIILITTFSIMFVYSSFFPANTFHQTSVWRCVLAVGYKQRVHPVRNFSLPVFSTLRLSGSHAGCILWRLSANTVALSIPSLVFKAQPNVFLSHLGQS